MDHESIGKSLLEISICSEGRVFLTIIVDYGTKPTSSTRMRSIVSEIVTLLVALLARNNKSEVIGAANDISIDNYIIVYERIGISIVV